MEDTQKKPVATTTAPRTAMDGTDYREILPKPSNDPNDPLNWGWKEKHMVLAVVSGLAFQGTYDAGAPAAGFVQQAEKYNVTINKMLYTVSVLAIFLGLGSLVWVPLGHHYGRSPIYCISAIVAAIGCLGGAVCNSWVTYLGTRIVNGFGASAAMALGSLTVRDLFFVHERGQKIGIWTLLISTSPYFATLLDGLITVHAAWRWSLWLTFFMWCCLIPLIFFCLPETLYHRDLSLTNPPPHKRYLQRIKWKRFEGKLELRDFYKSFYLIRYPSIVLPAIYYGNLFGFCLFGTLGILPIAFTRIYHFTPIGQGLVALPLLIGTILGEPFAGPFSDWVVRRLARNNGGIRNPEQRLHAMWLGAPLVSIGLMIFALTLHYEVHWIGPCFAIAIFSFGLQIVATVTFTYPVDCYEHLACEVGLICNICRQIFSFYVTLYLQRFVVRVGFGWVYGFYSVSSAVLFTLVIVLMVWGATWRKLLGTPAAPSDGHIVGLRSESEIQEAEIPVARELKSLDKTQETAMVDQIDCYNLKYM